MGSFYVFQSFNIQYAICVCQYVCLSITCVSICVSEHRQVINPLYTGGVSSGVGDVPVLLCIYTVMDL